ncbi:hypothetical protein [Psychromonas antarctica]|jgi:hypothetical protein|uniref:hypothetical protein n=1 Tax=Psychromonas antarctica TaxID=67573 RepID=UPI001EE88E1A|nr:hypothetical protein [Psychromonas antarctica]MCG6201517.1 hypothetical protein [Psychromonas antarctica]
MFNKTAALLAINWKKFIQFCSEIQQFQERIWIVSIQQKSGQKSNLLNDTFVVSEDGFDHPMQWMEKQGYQREMIDDVDKMQRSQALKIELENSSHSLIRVK